MCISLYIYWRLNIYDLIKNEYYKGILYERNNITSFFTPETFPAYRFLKHQLGTYCFPYSI